MSQRVKAVLLSLRDTQHALTLFDLRKHAKHLWWRTSSHERVLWKALATRLVYPKLTGFYLFAFCLRRTAKYLSQTKFNEWCCNMIKEMYGYADPDIVPVGTTDKCAICWDEFQTPSDDTAVVLNACRHRFHDTCMDEWYEERDEFNLTCPVCRKRFVRVVYSLRPVVMKVTYGGFNFDTVSSNVTG